jgi:callose synthase
MTRMGARAVEMKKIYATLRALLDVLEILVGQAPTDRLGRQILEEVIA